MSDKISFIEEYVTFGSINESPIEYHQWGALSTLAALLNRRVWLDMGFFTVNPQLYLVLVSLPGFGRKSTARKVSERLIREFPEIQVAGDKGTLEEIMQFMGKADSPCDVSFEWEGAKPGPWGDDMVPCRHLCVLSDELPIFLNNAGRPEELVAFLTSAYGKDFFDNRTKGKGVDIIYGPNINLLACCTTQDLQALSKKGILTSGLSRRCIFILAKEKGQPVAFPDITPAASEAFRRLVERAEQIKQLSGPFTWEGGLEGPARMFYKDWYDNSHYVREADPCVALNLWLESKHEMVLKIAMLLTISDQDELIITQPYIEAAIAMLDKVEPHIVSLFSGAGRNEAAAVSEDILQWFKSQGEIVPEHRIKRLFWNQVKDKNELEQIIKHLVETGSLKREGLTGKVKGKDLKRSIVYLGLPEHMEPIIEKIKAKDA